MDTIEMASISFNPNKMEFLISFTSGEREAKNHICWIPRVGNTLA
ncbi:MAG TPA: hypothetical protein VKA95_10150 [Nitrososphaeraceae archaeon]|nr:hypothetical protein [Nitrososphaeraceae archaeon]